MEVLCRIRTKLGLPLRERKSMCGTHARTLFAAQACLQNLPSGPRGFLVGELPRFFAKSLNRLCLVRGRVWEVHVSRNGI